MRALIAILVLTATAAMAQEKLSFDDRIEIIRGLTAEYATLKAYLPRTKKPAPVESTGTYDAKLWEELGKNLGPAARTGDLIQITKVTIEGDKISLEINGGIKSGKKFMDHVQIGMGGGGSGGMSPNQQGQIGPSGTPTFGTYVEILFHKPIPTLKTAEIKKMLAKVMDFDKRSATELYSETLSPELQSAIKDKRAIVGMDRDQVLLAMGRPVNKSRETKEGLELEDWIYGSAPGRITFVTFNGGKVIKVKESYAGLGAAAAPTLPVN